MPYTVKTHIDLGNGAPSLLIPVFTSLRTNIPYVQQMDEFMVVVEMIPFFDYENYPCISETGQINTEVGDSGIVAFRDGHGTLRAGPVTDVFSYLESNIDELRQWPLLFMQLQRIRGAELPEMYDAWRLAARAMFDRESEATAWVASEHMLFQREKEIWASLDSRTKENAPVRPFAGSPADFSPEYLIRWLSSHRNFESTDWIRIWRHVIEREPFDERLLEIGQNWLFFAEANAFDVATCKSVLWHVLEQGRGSGSIPRPFSEFLSEKFATSPYLVYQLLRPARLFENFVWALDKTTELGSTLEVITFILEQLPKLNYVLLAVRQFLVNIIQDDQHGEETKHLDRVVELYNRVVSELAAVESGA